MLKEILALEKNNKDLQIKISNIEKEKNNIELSIVNLDIYKKKKNSVTFYKNVEKM